MVFGLAKVPRAAVLPSNRVPFAALAAPLMVNKRYSVGRGNHHECCCRASNSEASGSTVSSQEFNETARLDELLDMLMACSDPQEFKKAVAENLLSFDQRFWMRLAARSDTAADEGEKERIAALASSVMNLVDAIVRKTETQLEDSGKILQGILAAGANENGEWSSPLPPEKLDALKQAMEERSEYLDEALLSNAFAWIAKLSEDGHVAPALALQKVLQLYAARNLSRGRVQNDDDALLVDIITADDSRWSDMIRELAEQGDLSETSFMEALQRKMESTVLALESGSYAQKVQAEYLKELEARGKAVFAELSGVA